MASKNDRQTLQAALRQAIETYGVSMCELARLSGVNKGQISRFMAGNDLVLSVADRLAEALCMELRQTRKPPKITPRKPGRPRKAR